MAGLDRTAARLRPDGADLLRSARTDPRLPSRQGASGLPRQPVADIPKSYAMVLAAELNRLRAGALPEGDRALIRTAGQWLLDHCDEDGDGIVGWGLPFAWDAYGDGTTNPADTEYTITTGIVVNALLDWADSDFAAPQERIVATVASALAPYLDGRFASPSGLFAYSLDANDLRYDCPTRPPTWPGRCSASAIT
ncbi:MAG: hypothetical protein IPI61_10175 [Syntrophaceae bacterium]|nr:hypothetical protein [Syntrophaceae bacterium]